MALPESLKSKLRAALPLQDAAARRGLKLQAEPTGWKVPCQWHDGDHTGSLHIYTDPDRGFHCFGCKKSGDVFTWLMELEHMDFMEAVEHLAALAGVDPSEWRDARGGSPSTSAETRKRKEQLFDLLSEAMQWFAWHLESGQGALVEKARAELAKRQLPEAFLQERKFGYAPDRWDGLVEHLLGKGYPLDLITHCGVVGRSSTSGKPYDILRHRLVIPIRSRSGQVISFAGRFLEGGETVKPDAAKYLNGTESEVFVKGATLYGLDKSLSMRSEHRWVLVEGYFDALALQAAGVPAVAPMGTAFGASLAQEIRRGADQVTIWFDPDTAGQKATLKAIPHLLATGLRVRVMRPVQEPGGSKLDPDLMVRRVGTTGARAMVDGARSSEDWASWAIPHLAHVNALSRSSRQDRAVLVRKVAEEILAPGFPPPAAPPADLVALMAQELEVPTSTIQSTLQAVRRERAGKEVRQQQQARERAVSGEVLVPHLDDLIWAALELMADGDLQGLEVVRQVPEYQWEMLPNGGLVLEVLQGSGVPATDLGAVVLKEASARRAAKLSAGNPLVLHIRVEQRVIDIQLEEVTRRLNDPLIVAQPEVYNRLVAERKALLIRKQRTNPGFLRKNALEGRASNR